MGKVARRVFDAEYGEERNHELAMAIYVKAIAARAVRPRPATPEPGPQG
jgi:hypothetical protein